MKTIEEEAINYSQKVTGGKYYRDLEIGFKAGAEFANRWIPVKEELPVPDELCLFISVSQPKVHLGKFSELTNGFVEMAITHRDIAHWRPIELK